MTGSTCNPYILLKSLYPAFLNYLNFEITALNAPPIDMRFQL